MRTFTEIKGILYGRTKLPKLLTAAEASEKTMVSTKRLTELALKGIAPCVRIDDGAPLFFESDIVGWVLEVLIKVQPGADIPVELKISRGSVLAAPSVPDSIRVYQGQLREFAHIHGESCIYFLIHENEVVYVGQSIKIGQRVLAHREQKTFDRVIYMTVPIQNLGKIELELIRELRPKLNVLGLSDAVKTGETELCMESNQ
jgi:hypothetical protein